MAQDPNAENWKTQLRKGYLELCIFRLIRRHKKLYGFEIMEKLSAIGLELKEGTLYPLLNRMANDQQLDSYWEMENIKGHPRKFYSISAKGELCLNEMTTEFDRMVNIFAELGKELNSGNAS